MSHLKPEHERKMRELLDQPIFDGGDAGELVNERARADRYERILAQVANVLGCSQDFGMILPNLLELKKQNADAREWNTYEAGRERAENRATRQTETIEQRAARLRFEGKDIDNATSE